MLNGANVCDPCPNNCDQCAKVLALTICNVCKIGFLINAGTTLCEACPINCNRCSTTSICTICS